MSVRLSKKFGLNPTIPLCAYCGKEKNEVVLLGVLRDENGEEIEAPKTMVLDPEPCDECRHKIEHEGFVGFFGDCGHNGLIKRTALERIVDPKLVHGEKVIRFEKCPHCLGMC